MTLSLYITVSVRTYTVGKGVAHKDMWAETVWVCRIHVCWNWK